MGCLNRSVLRRSLMSLVATIGFAACDDATAPERSAGALQFESAQFSVADAETLDVSVTVLDEDGRAFDDLPSGTTIAWSVSDAAVATVSAGSDSRTATVTGQRPGEVQLTAAIGELSASATLTIQQTPAEMRAVAGDEQVWYAGDRLQDSVVVRVLDRHGEPVGGVEVAFEVASGGGTVSTATVNSDDDGLAASAWTLGEGGGSHSLRVRAGDLEPVEFTATAIEVGTVTGRVFAPNGTTPVPGAIVTLAGGEDAGPALQVSRSLASSENPLPVPTAVTDVDGRYMLEKVPVGTQSLVARRGLFVATISVSVVANTEVVADASIISEKKLAYVPGAFDRIEDIVTGSLGQEIEQIAAADLEDPAVTDQFGAIFINCGSGIWGSQELLDNLRAYVDAGGLLYASDLELPLISVLFPETILQTASGSPQDVTADVVDPALRFGHLGGQETVEIRFDLSGWAAMVELSDDPNVLLSGDFVAGSQHEDRPLAIEIQAGDGRVVYTSFHNSASATADQIAVLEHYILGTASIGGEDAAAGLLRAPSRSLRLNAAPAHDHRHEHSVDWSRFDGLR